MLEKIKQHLNKRIPAIIEIKEKGIPFQVEEFSTSEFILTYGDVETGFKIQFLDKRLPRETYKKFYEVQYEEEFKPFPEVNLSSLKETKIIFENNPVALFISYKHYQQHHNKKLRATEVAREVQSRFDGGACWSSTVVVMPHEFEEIPAHTTNEIDFYRLENDIYENIPNFLKNIEYKINRNNMFIECEKNEKILYNSI